MTGLPCPTCGATRSMIALAQGRAAEAFLWNPLVSCGLVVAAAATLYAIGVLMGLLRPIRYPFRTAHARIAGTGFVILAGANWLWEIHRLT